MATAEVMIEYGRSEKNYWRDLWRCPFEVAVLDEVCEFYWYSNRALYVEDVEWTSRSPYQSEAHVLQTQLGSDT